MQNQLSPSPTELAKLFTDSSKGWAPNSSDTISIIRNYLDLVNHQDQTNRDFKHKFLIELCINADSLANQTTLGFANFKNATKRLNSLENSLKLVEALSSRESEAYKDIEKNFVEASQYFEDPTRLADLFSRSAKEFPLESTSANDLIAETIARHRSSDYKFHESFFSKLLDNAQSFSSQIVSKAVNGNGFIERVNSLNNMVKLVEELYGEGSINHEQIKKYLDSAIQPSINNNVERPESPARSEINSASCFSCLSLGSIFNVQNRRRIEPEQVFNVEGSLGYFEGSPNNLPPSPVGSVSSRTSDHLGTIQPIESSTKLESIPVIDGMNGLRR